MTQSSSKQPETQPHAPRLGFDPEIVATNLMRLMFEGSRAMSMLAERSASGSAYDDMAHAQSTFSEVYSYWLAHPDKLFEAQGALLNSYADAWSTVWTRLLGNDTKADGKASVTDKRFADPEWSNNPFFDLIKETYLATSRWSEAMLEETEGLDARKRRSAEFYTRFMMSAMSPSNSPLTNPEVMRATYATGGGNLVDGMRHLVGDLERSGDMLTISQTDANAFEVGVNLAVTPGKIVFQNEIFQLIQYAPATERVREIPLLIVPPWINKFYILDLGPQKSFVKYAVEQGFTVFLISWVNPDSRLAHKSFEDYVSEGLLTAADCVARETGVEKCAVLGYCIGGTLLGTTLAYLAALREDRFSCATFLTTQFDFTMAGDLSIFTSDTTINGIEKLMAERGYLDSSRIACVFNMMRSQDLIWPYVVNNYLMGRKPTPFDILYWNQDSTRMPAANHAFYLRQFYSENQLARGELVLNKSAGGKRTEGASDNLATPEDHIVFYLREMRGRSELPPVAMSLDTMRLNLGKVRLPIYELATKEDHIAPAISVFRGAKLFGGDVTFVVAGSGHIAGVINPPSKPKYQYWTQPKFEAETLDEWLASVEEHAGSWWPHWSQWLGNLSGDWVAPRTPGAVLGCLEDAPGSYVKRKL